MTHVPQARKLGDFFAHLVGEGRCREVPVGPDFWERGLAELPPGRLVSLLPTGPRWTTWERHPQGEEFILQLSGTLDLLLDDGDAVRPLTLGAGEFVVMPAGWWHTADDSAAGQALFITPGEGTEIRER